MPEKIDLVEKLAEFVLQFLANLEGNLPGYDYFSGGSRRFGYHTDESDADFFVYSNDYALLITTLEDAGFTRGCISLHYPTTLYTFRNIIHIGVYNDKEHFRMEKERNNRVARYLQAYPEVVKILRIITLRSTNEGVVDKNFSYRGSDLFNILDDRAIILSRKKDF